MHVANQDTPGDWKRILDQKGMFCILGLSLEKVLVLRGTSHHVTSESLSSSQLLTKMIQKRKIISIWRIAPECP